MIAAASIIPGNKTIKSIRALHAAEELLFFIAHD
jgi:hypothetical protein